ncbi:MAG: phage tail tube protein [Candidatus Bathyarchaeia archaeon]
MTYGAHEAKVYYVQETTYGATPTNPSMLGLKTAFDVEHNIDPGLLKLRGIGSRDLDTIKSGLRKPTLKFGYLVPSSAPINFLQYAVNLNSMSVEVIYERTSIIDLVFKGAKIDKVTVQLTDIEGENAVITVPNVELMGQNVVVGTSKITGATYAEYSGAVAYNESYVKKDAATLDRVTDWSWTIENHLKRVPVIRSTSGELLKYLRERHRDLYGELTFEFESKEEHDEVLADTEFSLEFGLGGTNKAVFGSCKWQNVRNVVRVEDLVAVKAAFVAKTVSIS